MEGFSERATPMADEELTTRVLKILKQASSLKQIKKGANETTKALNRGIAECVILAGDTMPIEILLHLPLLCEDKNVPYVFLPSKVDMGKTCGTSRNVIACAVLKNKDSPLNKELMKLRNEFDQLFINS